MKKYILSPLILTLLLVGCTITNDAQTVEDSGEIPIKQAKAIGFPLSTVEAQEMAEHLVGELHYSLSQIVQYEGENPSDILMLERLNEAKSYVTESFFTNYLSPEFYLCFEENCPEVQDLPLPTYLGLRHEVEPFSTNNYRFSTVFPILTDHQIRSFRQTLNIIFENDRWKITSFSNKDEDLNLKVNELEDFLITQISGPIVDIEYVGARQINGVEEEIYQFKDSYTNRPFEVIMRTGQINDIGEEFDVNELYADDYNYVSYDDLNYALLFDDHVIFSDKIRSPSKQVQKFLARDQDLDGMWAPPYSEDKRNLLTKLHTSYNDLLTEVYDYYSPFYPELDGVSELDQFFASWNKVRSHNYSQSWQDF